MKQKGGVLLFASIFVLLVAIVGAFYISLPSTEIGSGSDKDAENNELKPVPSRVVYAPSAEDGEKEERIVLPPEVTITQRDQQIASGPQDIRKIEGLELDTSGIALNLEQAISDLNADIRGTEILIDLSSDVLFDFDKVDIKPKAEENLAKVALIIREKAKGAVKITGHTDSKGDDEYNNELSLKRAKAVEQWLKEKGKAPAEYQVIGLGETKPVAENTNADGSDNPEGRAKNRRVEISIQSQES